MYQLLLYLLGFIFSLIPFFLLLFIGPNPNKRNIIYITVGIIGYLFVGIILVIVNLDHRINPEAPWKLIPRLSRNIFAAIMEETFRYPFILIAYKFANKITKGGNNVSREWTTFPDPNAFALYFGMGWGLPETFSLYIYPATLDYLSGKEWIIWQHILPIIYRITAVLAHIALTYIAMIITVNRGFWRITMLVHVLSNAINAIYFTLANSDESRAIVILFTRFSIYTVAYFIVRPKVRYISPAILFLIQVIIFLFFVLVATFIYLMSLLYNSIIVS